MAPTVAYSTTQLRSARIMADLFEMPWDTVVAKDYVGALVSTTAIHFPIQATQAMIATTLNAFETEGVNLPNLDVRSIYAICEISELFIFLTEDERVHVYSRATFAQPEGGVETHVQIVDLDRVVDVPAPEPISQLSLDLGYLPAAIVAADVN